MKRKAFRKNKEFYLQMDIKAELLNCHLFSVNFFFHCPVLMSSAYLPLPQNLTVLLVLVDRLYFSSKKNGWVKNTEEGGWRIFIRV